MARLATYEHLLRLNAGFEQVHGALAALSRDEQFNRTELRRLGAWSEQARASINSYLASVIEGTATETAGRLYRRRLAWERKDESGGVGFTVRRVIDRNGERLFIEKWGHHYWIRRQTWQ